MKFGSALRALVLLCGTLRESALFNLVQFPPHIKGRFPVQINLLLLLRDAGGRDHLVQFPADPSFQPKV